MNPAHLAVFAALTSLSTFAHEVVLDGTADVEPTTVEAQACRPTIACMAEIVPAGFFEVEAGYGGRIGAGQAMHSGQLLLKYSVLDHLQLQLATNNLFLVGAGSPARAVDGVMPGLKWVVNDQGTWAPSNALSVHLMMPTHSFEAAVQQTYDLQAWWYVSKAISFVHADLNVMLNVFDLGGTPIPQGLSSLAVAFDLTHGFGCFTELYSTWGNAQAVPLDGGSLNGFSFAPIDELVFDVGVDVGLYQATRALTVFAGVTFVPHRNSRVKLVRAPAQPGSTVASRR